MANEFIIRKGYKSLASSEVTGSLTLIGDYESIRALTINSTKGSGTEHYFRTHGVNGDTLAIYSGGSRVLSVDSNSIDVLGSISGSTYYGDGSNLTGVTASYFTETDTLDSVADRGNTTNQFLQANYFQVTGAIGLRKYISSWSNETTHDLIYNAWTNSTGDYTYVKAAGNGTTDHGIAFIGDNVFAVGRTNSPTGSMTDSATDPIDTVWFRANSSGVYSDKFGGRQYSVNSFLDFDDDSGVSSVTNTTTLASVGHMNFIIDSNNNGSIDRFWWLKGNTAPSSGTQLMSLDLSGNLEVSGDLTVAGTVTAQEFHTEYVSASIVYQSGSTKFGDTSDDNHDFTGSLIVNRNPGSSQGNVMVIQNTGDFGSSQDLIIKNTFDRDVGIRFQTGGGDYYQWLDSNGDDSLVFTAAGTNRTNDATLILKQDHSVTIPNGELSINTINQAASDTDKFLVSDSGAIKYRSGSQVLSDIGAAASSHNHNDLYFTETESDARYLRLTGGTMSGAIDFHQTDTEDIIITGNASATNADQFFLKHNFGNVDIGNLRGNIRFISGSVSVGTANSYAKLSVAASSHNTGISVNRQADTTAAIYIGNDGGNNPILAANNADMIFGRDVSGTFTEYMRIENGGNVGIGTNNPTEKLDVNGTARFRGVIEGDEATTLIKDVITDQTYEGTAFYNPETINAFAGANKWATVTISNAKSSDRTTAVTDVGAAPFMVGGSTFQPYFDTSETEIVIEIDHTAEPLRYHGIIGIQFTNVGWRAERVKIEGYNGTTWTTGLDTTTNAHGTVAAKLALGSAGVQKTKITLGNPANSSGGYMRISKIFGYDYKGVSSYDSTKSGTYYLEKFSNSGHYGTIFPAEDSTYDLGTNTLRYANIYADTLHGSVTTATTASNAMLLDGIDSTAFLRSNVDDTMTGVLTFSKENASPSITFHNGGNDMGTNAALAEIDFTADYQGSPIPYGSIQLKTNASSVRADMDFIVKSTSGNQETALKLQGGAGKPKSFFYNDMRVEGGISGSGAIETDYAVVVKAVDGAGNVDPATDEVRLSGYGLIGDRANLYLTNANASGVIKVGIGGVHNNSNVAQFDSAGFDVFGAVSASSFTGDGSGLSNITVTSASHAGSAPYSGLYGTVPTWNQDTTGTAATASYYDETDTLATVTGRGSETTTSVRFKNDLNYFGLATTNNEAEIIINTGNAGSPQIGFTEHGDASWAIGIDDADNSFKIHGAASATVPTINGLASPFFEIDTGGAISSSNGALLDGDVTLGTYAGTKQARLILTGTTANKQSIIQTTNGNLHIDSEDGHSLYLNYYEGTTDNVIIGNGNGGSSGTILKSTGRVNVGEHLIAVGSVYSDGGYFIFGTSTSEGEYIQRSGNDIRFVAGGSTRMTVDGDTGNVGIGNTGPGQKLHVDGGGIRVENSGTGLGGFISVGNKTEAAGNYAAYFFGNTNQDTSYFKGGIAYETLASTNGRGDMHFLQNSVANSSNATIANSVMTILNTGEVGIGTTTPGAQLTVEGSGSTVFDVQGSQGQLFSITDDLTGDLFSVSDISGIPILNVNASGDSYFDGNLDISGSLDVSGSLQLAQISATSSIWFNTEETAGILFRDNQSFEIGDINNGDNVYNVDFKTQGNTILSLQDGEAFFKGDVEIGTTSLDYKLKLIKADNNVSDHLQFYVGATRVGEIGGEDTTWLRINQETAKNIYTPRYIRADGGLFVDSTSYGIDGNGRLTNASLSGTYTNSLTFSGGLTLSGYVQSNLRQYQSTNWRKNFFVRSVGVSGADIGDKWVHLLTVTNSTSYAKFKVKFKIDGYDDVTSGHECITAMYENHNTGQEAHSMWWSDRDGMSNAFSSVTSIRTAASGLTNTYQIWVKMAGDWRDTFTVEAEWWSSAGTTPTFPTSNGQATQPTGGTGNDITRDSRELVLNSSMDLNGNLEANGNIDAYNFRDRDNTSYSLTPSSGGTGYWQVNTPSGYLRIGPQNSSWSHFYTDRGGYYFNTKVIVDGGTIGSYNQDLSLVRANGTADRILIRDTSIGFFLDSAEDMRLENDGDLHVESDIIAYSTTISDSRLKDDVITIGGALDKVKKLRGVEYTWNRGGRKDQRDLGLIAQEVEQVIPEIVREKKMPLMDDSDTKYKTVDYEKLTAVLIEGMKEQQQQIDELKAIVSKLQNEK